MTDMAELVASVADKEVANYLKEAVACYEADAYRACVVLTHTALFEDLRRKVRNIASVNAVAKAVSDAIEPLATNQKVFETTLIQKLKGAGIITQLESQILEQLNNQRNKAAHPSGHEVTPEEARFVFSEAIKKFLSKPIRETSYVVNDIAGRLGDQNFFPSAMLNEIEAVVEQELKNLAPEALPFLYSKLADAYSSADATTKKNAINFLLALASKRDVGHRALLLKTIFVPKSSNTANAEFLSMLITCDPASVPAFDSGTKLRIQALLMSNAQAVGVRAPYQELRQPAHVVGESIRILGEAAVIAELKQLLDWVVNAAPYSPEFIATLTNAPSVWAALFKKFVENAGSASFDVANRFASAAPSLDETLASKISDAQAFELVAAVVRAAEYNAWKAIGLANNEFASLPLLKAKARAYAGKDAKGAQAILSAQYISKAVGLFKTEYLS